MPKARYSSSTSVEGYSSQKIVRDTEISVTALRILPKLGMKLEGDELGTVTEPDFPGKFWIIQKSRKRVFADFAISDGFFEKSKSSTQTFLI